MSHLNVRLYALCVIGTDGSYNLILRRAGKLRRHCHCEGDRLPPS